jgi:tetratricopeptide (TPR) repeat protein
VVAVAGSLALLAATAVLGFPFLAIHELDLGITQSQTDVGASLADFRASHELNPLMSDPGTLAGSVALVNGRDATAAAFYRQAVSLEPGDWVAWLGRGLAASAQGDVDHARSDYRVALRLDADQPAVQSAFRQIGTSHPLTPRQAFDEINSIP